MRIYTIKGNKKMNINIHNTYNQSKCQKNPNFGMELKINNELRNKCSNTELETQIVNAAIRLREITPGFNDVYLHLVPYERKLSLSMDVMPNDSSKCSSLCVDSKMPLVPWFNSLEKRIVDMAKKLSKQYKEHENNAARIQISEKLFPNQK